MGIRKRLDNWEDGYDKGVENTLANVREAIEKCLEENDGLGNTQWEAGYEQGLRELKDKLGLTSKEVKTK